MEKEKFINIAGCVLRQRPDGMYDYKTLLCPECKKPLSTEGDDEYFCPLCGYRANKRHIDDAISRDKGRYGIP